MIHKETSKDKEESNFCDFRVFNCLIHPGDGTSKQGFSTNGTQRNTISFINARFY